MKLKTKQTADLLGILCLVTLLAAPAPVSGQEEADERSAYACWRGRPLPACFGFFLVEAQVSLPLASGVRPVTFSDGAVFPRETFETRVDHNLGYMVNVAPEWAVGGMLTMGLHAPGALTGISARVRRWLRDDVSVEVGAGALRTHGNSPPACGVGSRGACGDEMGPRWCPTAIPSGTSPYGNSSLSIWRGTGPCSAMRIRS